MPGPQEPGKPHLYPGADAGGGKESITGAPVLGCVGKGWGGPLHHIHRCLPAVVDGNSTGPGMKEAHTLPLIGIPWVPGMSQALC